MKVLSLFDGMSCGQIALNRIGIKPDVYYASELDKYAIKVTQANYPNTVKLGDVTKWREWDIDWASIDLLIGGSPCQGFSFAGKQLAFDDPRSKLFFVYVDILNHIKSVNPNVKFMLENVKMKKEYLAVISEQLGVEPVFINSALVSAQNRQRYYWCNWEVEQPEDRGIVLADILEADGTGFIKSHGEYKERSEKSQCIDANYHKGADNHGQRTLIGARFNRKDGLGSEIYKAFSLNASDWRGLNRNQTQTAVVTGADYRKLTPIECERLQTVPDNYTNHVSNTQRYKMLGNGWTVDVIAHIFSQGLL
ncbi:MAG: DNA (cytosine-5-)-methyltransferase [Vibrio splendidus]